MWTSIPGGGVGGGGGGGEEGSAVAIILVTPCWIFCDGLAPHPGENSNDPSHFMLGILQKTGRGGGGGSSITQSYFMLGAL